MNHPIPSLNRFPDLLLTISTRQDGNMKIRYELDKDKAILKNRENFLGQYGINAKSVITAHLMQGDHVELVSYKDMDKIIENTDSLITNEKGIFLAITCADCLPIFCLDPKKEAIALIHAGWRGLSLDIIGKTIKRLEKEYRSKSQDLIVRIGPGIGVCHFGVKDDVVNKFSKYQEEVQKRNGITFIDLKQIALKQFLKRGIKQKNIKIDPDCTYHEKEKYFSFRRDKSQPLEAMIALIGMRGNISNVVH